MARLFSKINTLLRARVEDFLEEDLRLPRGRRSERRAVPGSKALSREIEALRREIEAALDYEDDLQTRIDALRQDASDLDLQADNALLAYQEELARRSLEQLKRTEQQIAMLEADLAQHRQHAAALMDRVNLLEGLAAEAGSRRQDAPAATSADAAPPPAEEAARPVTVRVTTEESEATVRAMPPEPHPLPVTDEELAARRMRLARGDTQKE